MSARPASPGAPAPYKMSPEHRRVFGGLMLGMFVASVSQTIVGPAMPRIVAELGGMEHYSWVATAAMLVSAVTVPIVGKLSDLYGRRGFYLGGIAVFVIGTLVCGFAQSFWMLIAGRAIQGMGMGTLMPLSQTIIGDIIPARQRGKYQGLMGAVFGVTSVAGPLAGGVITDHLGWRYLFFTAVPIGLVALYILWRFLHLEHQRREAKIDVAGIVALTVGLTTLLAALSLGGTTYAWSSAQIVALVLVGVVAIVAFVLIERRAVEPVLPLRLFRSGIFTWSVVAAFAVSVAMFGAIMYIPVFAQGVLGVNATNSGLILMPLMVGFISLGIVTGMLITRTGRYKPFMVVGVVIMGVGYWLLTRLGYGSSTGALTGTMVVVGVGLGMCMQQYTLVVQNNADRADMGVATAATQFFRNVGSTVGIAIFGTAMTTGLGDAIVKYIPDEIAAKLPPGGGIDAGAVLDPAKLQELPAVVAEAVRQGLGDRLHIVFLLGLPTLAIALAATLLIKVTPLRDTLAPKNAEDSGHELLDAMSSSAAGVDDDLSGDADRRDDENRLARRA
ncbi:MDR family MFS transporter [Cumulibacter manganitolerans]|uniref:MDR family MFS transporter n=1 Tax=Cumulibacter manganitolerans TaxID=1884992 RepID=UPI0012960DC1|nr:MDR family MFS transporter [Cumulibacter manganitolerans]